VAESTPVKCEICHLNDATRAINRKVDGEMRELFVCDSCAATAASPASGGPGPSLPRSITDILFSVGLRLPGAHGVEDATCPVCGMDRGEVRATHRLGCPRCYSVFGADIRTFLSEQVPAEPRSREDPGLAMHKRELRQLRAELGRAVAEERYEDAAAISARIAMARRAAGIEKAGD